VARILHELRAWSGEALQSVDVTVVVLRRRFTDLGAELRSIVQDVLGAEPAAAFWDDTLAPLATANAEAWVAGLAEIMKPAQTRLGRGLARELHQQLRLALEDYRA
jgi:sigma-B regulation protein RsbU (phosphoserine phosphatase)